MRPLLAVSNAIDALNEKIGYVCNILVLLACLVSAANAMIRYAFSNSSNGWLDLIGTLCFLIPSCLLLAYLSWPFFMQAYNVGEMSGNAGGLIRWTIKFVIPAGFVLLALQGVSEVIKRIAALQGYVTIDAKYERPTQ